jgi:NADH-quinone oxidoreductase subunit J
MGVGSHPDPNVINLKVRSLTVAAQIRAATVRERTFKSLDSGFLKATLIAFFIFSTIAILGAFLTITARHPVHSVLSMIVTFFQITGLYLLLNAEFIAIIQIAVYAGAIMVLFLFVVMFMDVKQIATEKNFHPIAPICLILVLVLLGEFLIFFFGKEKGLSQSLPTVGQIHGTAESIGSALFSQYLVPFEVASILLLTAIIGAVVLAKR